MYALTLAAENDRSTTGAADLPVGSILLIVLPATIALIGVIISTIVSSVTTHRAEARRSQNVIYAQVLEAGRKSELEALYAVATFVAKLKRFNRTMSGNSGEGEDDVRSANAFKEFVEAFEGFDPLTRAAVTVEALGAVEVSEQIEGIRSATFDYVMALKPPIFRAAEAREFEARLDSMMRHLVSEVRKDFATDGARVDYHREAQKPSKGRSMRNRSQRLER